MSNVKAIPEGYHTLTPYLILKDPAKALEFYQKALGAKELFRIGGPGGTIGHAEMQIGNSRFMLAGEFPNMGAYSIESLGKSPITFVVYVEDVDSFSRDAVAAGMKVKSEIENKFYGDRMGTFTDPFGYVWHFATHVEDVSETEMKKRAAEMSHC